MTRLEALGHPDADVDLAELYALGVLRGQPRDLPHIGWEEGLLILARAVVALTEGTP